MKDNINLFKLNIDKIIVNKQIVKIGELTQEQINTLNIDMKPRNIKFAYDRISHCEKHKSDFINIESYNYSMQNIPQIINRPDYIGYNPQNNSIEYIMQKIDKAKPIVFYAGQNDINSNMVPYTEETQKYCSPIFKTSIDAGIYIAELCKKNKWNFVYKPHPMRIKYEEKSQLPNNTIYVENGNINDLVDISNVVVTILSQTNYISLVRHKPVVMLGYSQAKGKGCTYEAFEKDIIENVIRKALKNGFTEEQEKAFLIHIAQVLKYYLYVRYICFV